MREVLVRRGIVRQQTERSVVDRRRSDMTTLGHRGRGDLASVLLDDLTNPIPLGPALERASIIASEPPEMKLRSMTTDAVLAP